MAARYLTVVAAMIRVLSTVGLAQATGLPVLPRATIGTSFEVLAGVTTGGLVTDTSLALGLTAMFARGDWAFAAVVSETPASGSSRTFPGCRKKRTRGSPCQSR